MLSRDHSSAQCASHFRTGVASFSFATLLFLSTLLAGTSSADINPAHRALDIAASLPQRHAPPPAPARNDIAQTAEATLSSVMGIIDVMKQAQEVTAMLPSKERALPPSPKTDVDIALGFATRLPDFPSPSPAKKLEPSKPSASSIPAAQPGASKIAPLPTSQQLIWPADGLIYSAFNATRGSRKRHGAIDIVTQKGTPIAAAADGIVSVAANGGKNFSGYGKTVILDHGNGLYTVYAHCDSIIVKMGQKIRQGEYIATVGRTGRATTDHVHFEVRIAGQKHDPLAYLPSRPEMVKATNYHSPGKKK